MGVQETSKIGTESPTNDLLGDSTTRDVPCRTGIVIMLRCDNRDTAV